MQRRWPKNILAILALGVGGCALIAWLISGELSIVEVVGLCIGAYGLGVMSSRLTMSLIKRLKHRFNKLNGAGLRGLLIRLRESRLLDVQA